MIISKLSLVSDRFFSESQCVKICARKLSPFFGELFPAAQILPVMVSKVTPRIASHTRPEQSQFSSDSASSFLKVTFPDNCVHAAEHICITSPIRIAEKTPDFDGQLTPELAF